MSKSKLFFENVFTGNENDLVSDLPIPIINLELSSLHELEELGQNKDQGSAIKFVNSKRYNDPKYFLVYHSGKPISKIG